MVLESSPTVWRWKTCFASLMLVLIFARLSSELSTAAETGTSRPNVLVILTDDQGWGDLSLHGNPNLSTPNIDSLARDGAQLKNFYVCAVCSPTRAEFLTGRYHTRMGVFSTSRGGERFDLDERTIGDVFQSAGYATAAFGKWHSGMQPPYHPNARGFDEFYGFCSGHWGNYFSPMLEHNGEIVTGDGFLVNDLTDHAIEFVKQDREEPFFVYLPLNTPHSPMQVPDEDWAPFQNKDIVPDPARANSQREDVVHTRAALALCENIDDNVGRILESLQANDLADNTIVVYFCDNGPNGSRFNGGLRGRKGSVYEGGLRSPCIVRWPGKIDAGTELEGISGAIDLLPTLASLAGISIGRTAGPLDGVSQANRLRYANSRSEPLPDRDIKTAWNGRLSIRSQDFRYHPDGTLYEIAKDRGEQNDVSNTYPEVAQKLDRKLRNWVEETQPKKSNHSTVDRFPVGHPDYQWTQLPARDATHSAGIQRSNKYPNSSYMTGWTSSEDHIDWKVDVLAAGVFDVQMRYVCPKSAIGTQIQLELLRENLPPIVLTKATFEATGNTSVIGKQYDRTPRTEGYDKDWASMKIGQIALPKGTGTLRMTAPKVPGDQGIEMRLILLKRLAEGPSGL